MAILVLQVHADLLYTRIQLCTLYSRVGRFLNQGLRYVVVTRGTYYKTFRIIFDFLNSFLTEGYIVKVFILFLLLKNFKPSIT